MAQIAIPLSIIIALALGVLALIAWATSLSVALLAAFVVVSAAMMLVVLIQRPKGGGLSGAFGGAGGDSGAVFGSKVGDVLTWVTVAFFVAFVGLAMALTYTIRAEVSGAPTPAAETVQEDGLDAGAGTSDEAETAVEDPEAAATEAEAAAEDGAQAATNAAEQAAEQAAETLQQAAEEAGEAVVPPAE